MSCDGVGEALDALRAKLGSGRVEVPVAGEADPLAWLAGRPAGLRTYWRSRDGRLEIAGIGAAMTVPARAALAGGAVPDGWPLLGGMAFDPDSGGWPGFGSGWFRVPALTLERRAGETVLAAHGDAGAAVEAARRERAAGWPEIEAIDAVPDRERWAALVRRAVAEQGKVVLARRMVLRMTGPLDPFEVLLRMARRQRDTFVFGFEVEGAAFVGCTPERLFRRSGRAVQTEALAGTRPAGADPAAFLESEKDRREHDFVVRSIRTALAPLCTRLSGEGPHVRALSDVMHLRTRFSGRLCDGVGDGDLVRALHPTPAVCGEPREAALHFIRTLEPGERGWYAGPVGWLGSDETELAVALRSARVWGSTVEAWAGAGIVAGSDPAAEWAETAAKSRAVVEALVARDGLAARASGDAT